MSEACAAIEPYCRLVCTVDGEYDGACRVTVECGEPECQEGSAESSPPRRRREAEVDEFDRLAVGTTVEEEDAGRNAVDSKDMPPVRLAGSGCEVAGQNVGRLAKSREPGTILRDIIDSSRSSKINNYFVFLRA